MGYPIWISNRIPAGMTIRERDEMCLASDTAWAPWYVVHSDEEAGAADLPVTAPADRQSRTLLS
jgi:hypothetical protein